MFHLHVHLSVLRHLHVHLHPVRLLRFSALLLPTCVMIHLLSPLLSTELSVPLDLYG